MPRQTRRLRLAVIGLGSAGQFHCEAAGCVPEIELVAVVDADAQRVAAVAGRYGVRGLGSVRELLATRVCDAVSLATPHPAHGPIALACLNARLHVLCEKPLAEAVGVARRMTAAARRNGVALGCCLQYRYSPHFIKALELARSGVLGELRRAALVFSDFRTQAYYDTNVWRATWAGEGGGVLLNQAPHYLDLFVRLTGLPVSVRGRLATRLHKIEVEDQAEALLRYRNGASGYVYCSTNEPYHRIGIELVGDRGKLEVGPGTLALHTFEPGLKELATTGREMWGRPEVRPVAVPVADCKVSHRDVLANFARHLLDGEPLLCDAGSAVGSLELANAITLSHFTDCEVRIPLAAAAYQALLSDLKAQSVPRRRVRVQYQTDPRMR